MPRIVLFDPVLGSRLLAIAALSPAHDVHAVSDAADVLKAIRRLAPDVVLLALPPGDIGRLCRAIRTDTPSRSSAVPRLGFVVPVGSAVGPSLAIDTWGADGWLGNPADLPAFVSGLLAGPLPVRMGVHAPGLAARIVHRMRRIGL